MFMSTELDYTDLYLSHFIYISLLGETGHAMLTSLMVYSIQRIGECPLLMFLSHSCGVENRFWPCCVHAFVSHRHVCVFHLSLDCRLWPPTVSLTKLKPQEGALDKRIKKIKAEGQKRKSQRWKKNKDGVFKEGKG